MASTDDDSLQPPPKRLRHDAQADEGATPAAAATEPQVARVELNPADCNLDFDIGGGGLQGQALHEGGFAYCWSGARATVGVRGGGKYCFGCRVVAEQAVEMDDTAADQRHLCRIGVSRGDDPVGGLGESGRSFGFGGTGKLSHQGKFVDYGVKFGVGDKVVCAVDLDSKPMASIGFSRNGEWLGIAKHFDASENGLGLVDAYMGPMQWESAIFPHVLLKNVVVEMQFSREDGLEPVDGYEPWASACADGNAVYGPVFAEQQRECEVMMMVGLPASGKSTWAEKWIKEHPEKRFILLGTNFALDQMKVPGLLRKHNYGERFDRLMDHATTIFNTLLDRAAKIPRNYIIDQTNVYKNARIRKLRPFTTYRKTAVVMFPFPSELKSRAAKRFKEMGKEVPAEAVGQMIANFVLPLSKDMPGSKEPFDEVIFVELSRDDAQRSLDEMKRLLPKASTPSHDNFNIPNVSSTYTGISSPGVSGARPSLPGVEAMDNSYGRGVHSLDDMTYQQAPLGVQGFQSTAGNQHKIQSSYLNTPYQHQTHTSYTNAPNQHLIHPSYPNTTNQHQIHPSYPSTVDQHQIHGSYPSTPLPGYGHNTCASHGSPSPYNANPYSTDLHQRIQAPMGDTNLYQTLGPAEHYGRSGYGARPLHAQPLTSATYSSHPVHQQMPYHDNISSWSSGNYRPYGQNSLDVHNTGSQYAAPVPRPPPRGALPPPNHMT